MEQTSSEWTPKTSLGKEVLAGKYPTISDVLRTGKKIIEAELVDHLIKEPLVEYINLGQARGKFGGGRRKSIRNTQKVAKDGKKIMFSALAAVGNGNGVLGIGYGKCKETIPAKEKSLRQAKKNIIMIRRGCGDWACFCGASHSIPFTVEGKCGSVKVKLMPAPKGTGLVVEEDVKHLLRLAGVNDVWSRTIGQTKHRFNLIMATFDALQKLSQVRLVPSTIEGRGIKEGEKNE